MELSLLRSRLILLDCQNLEVVPPTSSFVALKLMGNREDDSIEY